MVQVVVICFVLFLGVWNVYGDETVERLGKAIEATTDPTELGRLHKQLGDHYVAQDRLDEAAEAYLKALSLARESFSLEERRVIAVHLSWAGRLREAIEELQDILARDPENVDSRTHLARTLSWAGDLEGAVREADEVLRRAPGAREALLVKANALRWQGDLTRAIPLYEELLEEEEEFGPRLGLSFALLSRGDIKGSRTSAKLLRPEYPFQERELEELTRTMRAVTHPRLDLRYSRYEDSDDNIVDRYMLFFTHLWIGNWRLDGSLRHTAARDPRRDVRADDLEVRGSSRITERVLVRAGVGVSQVEGNGVSNFLTGHVGGEARMLRGTIGVGVSRETFVDIAPLIANEIRITDVSAFISQQLIERLSLYGEYHFRDYSDRNHSHDVQVVSTFVAYRGVPRVGFSYRFRYLNFDRQSGGGYFDPDNYFAHRVSGALSFDTARLYGSAEPFVGWQSFRRFGIDTESTFWGGDVTFGFRLSPYASLEANGSISTEAGVSTGKPGFRSHVIGARFVFIF